MGSKQSFKRQLRKAISEHYKWHHDKKSEPVKWVSNRDGYQMLLVHVTDEDGFKWSVLMHCMEWKDGHWDVDERQFCCHEFEESMVHDFEMSGMVYVLEVNCDDT